MSKLSIRDLKVNYPDFKLDISFETEDNEFISIIGPSGCGKSTVLTSIAGLTNIDSGKIELDGNDITNEKVQKRNIGFVFQDYALFSNMNVEKNISYSLNLKHVSKKQKDARVKELLSLTNLSGYEKRRTTALSGGEQQRVALSRALASAPHLLLLDEPLSALDAALRRHLKGEIRRIHDESENMSTIYVTHDREEAFSISDRIIIMRDGHIEMIGTPEEVYRHPETLFAAYFTGEGTSIDASFFNMSLDADTIFFRPEAVTVKDGIFYGATDTTIKLENAKIISAEFIGSRYILGLMYEGQPILAEATTYPSSSSVDLYIRKSQILFYKAGKLVK